jgi:hypothetical protein
MTEMILSSFVEKKIDYMERDEVLAIPKEHLPLMVLSSSIISPMNFGISLKRKTIWGHFMWMHKPGLVATQNWTYCERPIQHYLGFDRRLKFWSNPNWTIGEKTALLTQIQTWLDKPAYTTIYDFVAIAGQALNLVWLQNPATKICSDYGSFLKESGVDPDYNLKYPAPDQVDDWLNSNSKYRVYGRYAGE